MIFTYEGSLEQQAIASTGVARIWFPHWERLLPKLARKGRTSIPIGWDNLSRYAAVLEAAKETGGHAHIYENGDTADPIEYRNRVLGLAWYSGKITLEETLVNEPELAQVVLGAELAHMVDFFDPLMDAGGRGRVNAAYHGVTHEHEIEDHDHEKWFDEGGYWDWPGESFMEGFTRAFSDIPTTMGGFTHKTTPEVVRVIRDVLDPRPEPKYGGVHRSKVYHRLCCFMLRLAGGADFEWVDRPEGRRGCKLCRP